MAETGEETYYIVGESRTNVDNAITKVYGSFFIAFEVIPSTGEIIQTDCSRTLELTNDFILNIPLRRSRLSGKMETTCPDRRKPL